MFMCVAPGVCEVTVGLIVNYLHFVYLVSCTLEGILESLCCLMSFEMSSYLTAQNMYIWFLGSMEVFNQPQWA